MLSINWLDFVIILGLAVGMGIGYARGLLHQVIGLAALYLGAVLAAQYFHVVSNALRSMLSTTPSLLLNAVAFFLILFGVMVVLNFLAQDAYRVRLSFLPALDNLGGMILGLFSAWIVATLVLNILALATNAQSWQAAEQVRRVLQTGISGSQIAGATASTMPALLAAIKPWLPTGLPGIFNL